MLKVILIIFLALFFFASGINHFLNPMILEEYMEKREFKYSRLLVKISGFALILGGVGLVLPHKMINQVACYGLAAFVLLAAFLVHSFWRENEKHLKMLEAQNFIKNFVIFFEMLYLSTTF